MNVKKDRISARIEKRKQIEEEIRRIVLSDQRDILIDNMRRRRRREFQAGDRVRIIEWLRSGGNERGADCMYRVTEGVVVQVTGWGYFVEGISERGLPAKDFVNKSHLINGTVKMDYQRI